MTSAKANEERAELLVRACAEAGVERFFIAPGSRSTPLVAAVARTSLGRHLFLDERAAAFAAVGAARVGGKAAVITTSGTAVANLLPALAEAEVDELPLVALTADRPHELVGTGANQTLNQPPLLAGAARAALDLPAPPAAVSLDELRAALAHLDGPARGPVHLNARFAKPLEPVSTGPLALPAPRAIPAAAPEDLSPLVEAARGARAGIVVVGGLPLEARAGAARLLEVLGWPFLADITSGLARAPGRGIPTVALRSARARAALKPDLVLWVGARMTDPDVARWLQSHDSKVVQLKPGAATRDPDGLVGASWTGDPGRLAAALEVAPASALAPVADALAAVAPVPPEELSEPRLAREVLAALGEEEVLVLGNSMPVRDADRYARDFRATLVCNRGASGIDGNLATALGAHLASGRPTTALVGDLTFLHDATSLVACAQARADLRVVVVNNGGGGIFHFLPIAGHGALFDDWFSTPHAVEAAPLATALGVRARRVTGLATLRAILARPPSGPELIEVVSDQRENRALHARLDEVLEARVALALDELGDEVGA